MAQARATRFYAENKGGSARCDLVAMDTSDGEFNLSYDNFLALFDISIPKGEEVAFEVSAKLIEESECKLPR